MNIRVEGERRLVVAEPRLYLFSVQARLEQERPQRVKARPRHPGRHGGRIGVGAVIPLTTTRHWDGFMLGHDPETGALAWLRRIRYGSHPLVVELFVYQTKVTSIKIMECGTAAVLLNVLNRYD